MQKQLEQLVIPAKAYFVKCVVKKPISLMQLMVFILRLYGLQVCSSAGDTKKTNKGGRHRETTNPGIWGLQYRPEFEPFAHLIDEYMVPCHVCKSLKLKHDPVQRVRCLQKHLDEHAQLLQECIDGDTGFLESFSRVSLQPQEGEYVEVLDRERLLSTGNLVVLEMQALLDELERDASGTKKIKKQERQIKGLTNLLEWARTQECDQDGLICQTKQYTFANPEELARLFYSLDGPGCQNIPGVVRNAACGTTHHDIDMDNANPSIEIQMIELKDDLARAQGLSPEQVEKSCWNCEEDDDEDSPIRALRHYVDDRETVFGEVISHYDLVEYCTEPRRVAKNLFIRILFGGTETAWLTDNKIEFRNKEHLPIVKSLLRINDKIVEKFKVHPVYRKAFDLKKRVVAQQKAAGVHRSEWKTDASAIAWAVHTEENRIMMAMLEFFQGLEWAISVLMFDGFMVRRQGDSVVVCKEGNRKYKKMNPQLLRDCEACILEKTGYKIGLSEKDMLQSDEIEEGDHQVQSVK